MGNSERRDGERGEERRVGGRGEIERICKKQDSRLLVDLYNLNNVFAPEPLDNRLYYRSLEYTIQHRYIENP